MTYPVAKPDEDNLTAAHHVVVHHILDANGWDKQNGVQYCCHGHGDDVDVRQEGKVAAACCFTGLLQLDAWHSWL